MNKVGSELMLWSSGNTFSKSKEKIIFTIVVFKQKGIINVKEKWTFEWDKDITADGYIVKYQDNNQFEELVRVENTDLTTIVVPKIRAGIENHFRVSYYRRQKDSYYIYKEEDYYCFVKGEGTVIYRFPTPKMEKAIRMKDLIIIEWGKVSDEVTYLVSRKVVGGKWIGVGKTKEACYVDKHADMNKKYAYTVRCISNDGEINLSGFSLKGISV